MGIKKQIFNGEELAMLFQAFSKRLFVRPQKGEIYSMPNHTGDNSHTFFITLPYYEKLLKEIQDAYLQGKFVNSNAKQAWISLMNKFINASNDSDIEVNNLEDYYDSVSPFWL